MTACEALAAMPALQDGNLRAILQALPEKKLLCVGDLMLDVEIPCSRPRVSPEAPVLVFNEGDYRLRAGGAGNVAVNMAALGAAIVVAGFLGDDPDGQHLRTLLEGCGVAKILVAPAPGRPTTRKTRVVADGQQVVRLDREETQALSAAAVDALFSEVEHRGTAYSAIVISDYGKGLVTADLLWHCHRLAKGSGAPLFVDPKGLDWARYGPVQLIKPNASELAAFTGLACGTDEDIEVALRRAMQACEAEAILVTRSEKGASLLARGGEAVLHRPARAVEVADVCGAGDTNLAVLACMIAGGLTWPAAVDIAQAASALAVQRHGNAVVSAEDLLAAVPSDFGDRCTKIQSRDAVRLQAAQWRSAGLRVGFTNGCFDLLHTGHVLSLEQARQKCDRLIVGLNSDASVRRLKGATRPIICENDRARVLAGLSAVDAVCLFEENTPEALIAALIPDVLIKGGDYDPSTIAGADIVKGAGGEILASSYLPGRSTSDIIAKIQGHPPLKPDDKAIS